MSAYLLEHEMRLLQNEIQRLEAENEKLKGEVKEAERRGAERMLEIASKYFANPTVSDKTIIGFCWQEWEKLSK